MRYDFVEAHRDRWLVWFDMPGLARLARRLLRLAGEAAEHQGGQARGPGRRDQVRSRRDQVPLYGSPRIHAEVLQDSGLATLLFDLLTVPEETIDLRTRHLRFDIDLLARRTAGVLEWLDLQPFAYHLKKGLFGASTGAAAALIAAAELPDKVDAIVSTRRSS